MLNALLSNLDRQLGPLGGEKGLMQTLADYVEREESKDKDKVEKERPK